MTGKCTICGGICNDLDVCDGCGDLSHYEQRKLYLLNCLVEKKPHGYWREVAEIQKSLETIAAQLTKMNSGEE